MTGASNGQGGRRLAGRVAWLKLVARASECRAQQVRAATRGELERSEWRAEEASGESRVAAR